MTPFCNENLTVPGYSSTQIKSLGALCRLDRVGTGIADKQPMEFEAMTLNRPVATRPSASRTRMNAPIDELREIVMRLLPSGYPKLEIVARELRIARRTLQRRLAAAETSYTDLVNEARLELAARLLRNRDRSIASIAFSAGFANHSGFSRAFHRWTGMTPRQYRARARRNEANAATAEESAA